MAQRCPQCGSADLHADEHRGELVCRACGLVIEEGTLAQTREPSERRAGPSTRSQRLPRRLERAKELAEERSGSERRMLAARQELERLATVLACPRDVAERGARLLERAREAGLTQGRALDALAPAALLASCRMLFLTRTETELAKAARVDKDAITQAYRALVAGLDLAVPPMTAHEYMAQVASRLGASPALEARAREVLRPVCGTHRAAGKNPLGWAAAALVVASRGGPDPISLRRAAQAADVATSTVKARVDDLAALDP